MEQKTKVNVKVTDEGIVVDDVLYNYEVFKILSQMTGDNGTDLENDLVEAFFSLSSSNGIDVNQYTYLFWLLRDLLKKTAKSKYISDQNAEAFILGLQVSDDSIIEEYEKKLKKKNEQIKKLKRKLKQLHQEA
jgi:hypothetical protein